MNPMMKLIYEHKEAMLWYDEESRIIKVEWIGTVDLEAFCAVLLNGGSILNKTDNAYLLLDRRRFVNFTPEARIWFKKDFMNRGGSGRRLIRRVRKIAAIKSSNPLGQVTVSMMAKLLLFFNPYLDYKTFDEEKEANDWVSTIINSRKVMMPSNKLGWFDRLLGM